MEDRKKENNYCKKCKTKIKDEYVYCSVCNEMYNTEIAVVNKFPDDLPRTIAFFKIKLLDMFRRHNKIILSFTKSNMHIADIVIRETNFFYLQEKRYITKEKSRISPTTELEIIKAPLKLPSAIIALKEEKKWYD